MLLGKCYENIICIKYDENTIKNEILSVLGLESIENLVKQLQGRVLEEIKTNKIIEWSFYSESFARVILEILKTFINSHIGPDVNSDIVNSLVEMGFTYSAAKKAFQYVPDMTLESATEWILKHPEAEESKGDLPCFSIEGIHSSLVNLVAGVPKLHEIISEVLLEICSREESPLEEVTLMLLSAIGILGNDLLSESSLKNATYGTSFMAPCVYLDSFEQLSAFIFVLRNLSKKVEGIAEIVKEMRSVEHLMKFILKGLKTLNDPEKVRWLHPAFSLIHDFTDTPSKELMQQVIELIQLNSQKGESLLAQNSLLSLLGLVSRLAENSELAQEFIQSKSLFPLLTLRTRPDPSLKRNILDGYSFLIKNLCGDEATLQLKFEGLIQEALTCPEQLHPFLSQFSRELEQNEVLFKKALKNTTKITEKNREFLISQTLPKERPKGSHWGTIAVLSDSLCHSYSQEQILQVPLILPSEAIIFLLSEAISCYSCLSALLLSHTTSVTDRTTQTLCKRKFHSHLLRNIIPFKFDIQIAFSTINFKDPSTEALISHEVYQDWLKCNIKLLKSLLLPGKLRQDHPATHRVFREIRDIISEQNQKPASLSSLKVLSALSIILTKLLQESPKLTLYLNKLHILPLLATSAVHNTDLASKTAPTVLKMLLTPIELILRYIISASGEIYPIESSPTPNLHHAVSNSDSSEELRGAEDDLDPYEENESEEDSSYDPPGDNELSESEYENSSDNEEASEEDSAEEGSEEDWEEYEEEARSDGSWENEDTWHLTDSKHAVPKEKLVQRSRAVGQMYEELTRDFVFKEQKTQATSGALEDARKALEHARKFRNSLSSAQLPPSNSSFSSENQVEESKEAADEIDPEFLAALPEELRDEILSSYKSQHEQPSNLAFITSLSPELRREILCEASEEFLSTLPKPYRDEVHSLQSRVPLPKSKRAVDLPLDEKLNIPELPSAFIELLVNCFYLNTPVSKGVFSTLLLSLTASPNTRKQVLDALVFILLQQSPVGDFPPSSLLGSDTCVDNFAQVHAIVTGRVLDMLLYLAKANPAVSLEFTASTAHCRLPFINKLQVPPPTALLHQLLSLADSPLLRTSTTHLTPFICLISSILEQHNEDPPELSEHSVSAICGLLTYPILTDHSVNTVAELVSILSANRNNCETLAKIITSQVECLARETAVALERAETSAQGDRELSLLRLYKLLQRTQGAASVDCLWSPLTHTLCTITEAETHFATTTSPTLSKLLPVIETFFLAHKDGVLTEEFHIFCDKNQKVLNLLIRQNPTLLSSIFSLLTTRFPSLLDFENKKNYFRAEIRKLKPNVVLDYIRLHVRRNEVFMDSYHQLKVRKPEEMHGKLRVQFVDEEGIDAGGVTREWYSLLAREMFNPNYALFIPSANGVSFQPNSMSHINSEHLDYFKFVGRIIGKALCDGHHLDVYFTRSFYKHILGQEVTYQDMEDLDPDFFKSLQRLHEIDLNESELHEYYFAYEVEEFGKLSVKELVSGGRNTRVTEENKNEYINLLCHMKMTNNIKLQIVAFLGGFYEIVPKQFISIFDSKELELLISGLPEIDLEDLKANAEYHNYTQLSEAIIWLWECLYEFSHEERAEFLQFVTGSSKVPLEGFKSLPGMGGVQKFQIHKSFTETNRLPTAHTCMNQLDLPEYPCKELLRKMLKIAISEGKEGFGFL